MNMKTIYILLLLCSATISFAQSNEQALKSIIEKQESDWNKNDMKSFSEPFSDDAVVINFLISMIVVSNQHQ
jgi:hypothetical protein